MTTPEDTELREKLILIRYPDGIEPPNGSAINEMVRHAQEKQIDRLMNLITLHTEKEVKRKMDIIKMSDSYTFITGEKYYNQRMMDRATNEARIDELKQFVTELNTVSPYEPLKGTPREYVEEKAKKRFAQLTPKENK